MVTRKDVAEKAGVSFAVVSRVLNDSGYVAQDKRDRVLKAVEELRYKPNPVARSLKSNRTNQLLFYIRDLSNNYYLDMYKGVMESALESGFNVIISGNLDVEQIGDLMVDGVILPFEGISATEALEHIEVPMVAASYGMDHSLVDTQISVDLAQAVTAGLVHLETLGHRVIGFASMEQDPAELRLATFLAHWEGGNPLEAPVFGAPASGKASGHLVTEFNYFEAGILAARQYLAGDRKATALLCFNDDMAVGLMSHLQGEGLSIPRDVSVVGIDNHLSSAYSSPPLTTVSLHPVEHGRKCAEALIDQIEGRPLRSLEPIRCELVVRRTTAPPT